jgi:hypothetical protein
MKTLPEGSAGQALALAILALIAAAFYLLIISPTLALYDDRAERLQQRAAMAERYQNLVRELPSLQIADKQWRDGSGGELLLDGQSDAVASAALQAQMKSLVEEAGAKLSSAEVIAGRDDGRFRRVGLRVVFSGDFKLVTTVFRGMETARPKLYVGDFDLHAGGASKSSDEDSDEDSGALAVTMDIYGFRAV